MQIYGVKLVGADAHGAGISSTTLSRIVVVMGEPANKSIAVVLVWTEADHNRCW